MGLFPRPCLDCGHLTRNGPRCPRHADALPLHGAAWSRMARAWVVAHPVCIECGATEDLTCDHIEPGTLRGGLQTLCRSCNSKKGGAR